jgi:hypothetical protein
MRGRGPWGLGLGLVALTFAPAAGCGQILGIHDLDAGPLSQGSDGSDVGNGDGSSLVSSGASSGGSSSGLATSTSGRSSSGGQGSAIVCTSPSGCSSGQICCGTTTPSLMSTCQPRASGCPVGNVQLCDTTTDCVTPGATCQSYMGVVKICESGGGTGADGGPAGLSFTPSNFNPTTVINGGVDWSAAQDGVDGLSAPVATIAMNDANATQADLYVLRSWVVRATSLVTLSGQRPAIVLVLTTVDIQGSLVVQAGGFQSDAPGPGGGQWSSAGSGGSYCGVGGAGGLMSGSVAPGKTFGTSTLTPLVGGSAGGEDCALGAGGGAVQIVAGVSIAVRQYASINAGGSGGCSFGGGGSGGGILLEAPSVQIAGKIAANGGSGGSAAQGATATADNVPAPGAGVGTGMSTGGSGSAGQTVNGGAGTYANNGTAGGGGGAGRIRINTMSGVAAITGGTVSPELGAGDGGAGSATSCATQGTLGR